MKGGGVAVLALFLMVGLLAGLIVYRVAALAAHALGGL